MDYRGRFAPSPTGRLHFGSLLAALASWLCARHAGGRWLLRVEDIDPQREVAGAAAAIVEALARLGMEADEPVLLQSRRDDAYAAALDDLRRRGLAFPCWCSRSALAEHGGVHRHGHCVSPPQHWREPAWRLRSDGMRVAFDDALQGHIEEDLGAASGDFVLRRADGFWAYQLACAVDDDAQRISEMVRGRDLLASTPRQIAVLGALQRPTPRYRHIGLALDGRGRKLSKSAGDRPLDTDDGRPALRAALHRLGCHVGDGPPPRLLRMALEIFDPAQLPRHDIGADFHTYAADA